MTNSIEQSQAWAYDLFIPNQLDGDPEFSQDEQIAFWYLLDQYGHPNFIELNRMREEMSLKLNVWYGIISGVKPKKQVVYIDFSEFHDDYSESHNNTVSYGLWQEIVIKNLEEIFTNANGQRLNIEFVTRKPSSGDYTTVVLKGKQKDVIPARFFRERSDDEKITLMKWFLSSEDKEDGGQIYRLVSSAVEAARNENPGNSEEQVLLKAFEHSNIQSISLRPSSPGHYYATRTLEEEFGNQDQTGLITLHAIMPLQLRQESLIRDDEFESQIALYKYMGCAEKLDGEWFTFSAENYAEGIAHYLGHALGMHHHGRWFKKSTAGTFRPAVPDEDVMSRLYDFPKIADTHPIRFSDGAMVYLKRVLGVK